MGVLSGDIASGAINQIFTEAGREGSINQYGLKINHRAGRKTGFRQLLRGLQKPGFHIARQLVLTVRIIPKLTGFDIDFLQTGLQRCGSDCQICSRWHEDVCF